MTTMSGWGAGGWGLVPWGAGGTGLLQVQRAIAIRSNLVRVWFSEAPLYTGTLDQHDASNSERFAIVPVAGSIAKGPRPVWPVKIEVAAVAGALGSALDVTTDRRFSPYPARYLISGNQLVGATTGSLLDPAATSAEFYGLLQYEAPPSPAVGKPSYDLANPQLESSFMTSAIGTEDEQRALGSLMPDETGDYALDSGITNLRKRVFRRLMTGRDRFAHLAGYGIGIVDASKQLARNSTRSALATEARQQILEEPDVADCSVSVALGAATGLIVFYVKVRTRQGLDDAFAIPFSIG